MTRFLVVCALLLVSVAPLRAEALNDADRSAFRDIITSQLEAFKVDDGATAYSYAAPMIKQIFPTQEVFMDMVRRGYAPVYRPQSYNFGKTELSAAGRPIQRVTIIGPDGLTYEAIYTMERQPDGTWQINGCSLVRAPDISA